jgi:hypothetical protein
MILSSLLFWPAADRTLLRNQLPHRVLPVSLNLENFWFGTGTLARFLRFRFASQPSKWRPLNGRRRQCRQWLTIPQALAYCTLDRSRQPLAVNIRSFVTADVTALNEDTARIKEMARDFIESIPAWTN